MTAPQIEAAIARFVRTSPLFKDGTGRNTPVVVVHAKPDAEIELACSPVRTFVEHFASLLNEQGLVIMQIAHERSDLILVAEMDLPRSRIRITARARAKFELAAH